MEKNFEEIKKEYDEKTQEELKKTGIFYAFSNEQFEEYRTHKDIQGKKYFSIGCGAYIHEDDKQKLDNYFNVILPKLKKDFIKKINIDDLIEYELINHECYYTGNYLEIVELMENYLESDITQRNNIIEKIKNVYNKNYKKNMEVFQ